MDAHYGGNVFALGVCYMIASIGTGSMFVNQTVMLSDIVDYGEYKMGSRNQGLTFSMKGFLQKMAYTIQSIIMYASFGITKYQVVTGNEIVEQTAMSKSAISALMFIIPPLFMLVSLAVFSKKYKIYGEYKTEILEAISNKRAEENE